MKVLKLDNYLLKKFTPPVRHLFACNLIDANFCTRVPVYSNFLLFFQRQGPGPRTSEIFALMSNH